jgi:hypothetical protein
MRNPRKAAKIAAIVFVAVVLLAQAVRVEKLNPSVRSDDSIGPAVKPLLRRACYNCHSNETVWPWYSNVAPASWLVASDVHDARRHVNFSEWDTYGRDGQARVLKAVEEEIREGDMPLWYYALVHREARLTQAERDRILAWAAGAAEPAAR